MALLLSVSFSMPPLHRRNQFPASYLSRSIGGRLLDPLTSRTATVRKHLQPKSFGGGIISSKEIRRCNVHPSSRQCLEPVSCQISGFWMGPDVEDGWGFIQASVLILSSSNLT